MQESKMMVEVILEETCNEVVAVVIVHMLAESDGHSSMNTSIYEVIRKQLTSFQELVVFSL